MKYFLAAFGFNKLCGKLRGPKLLTAGLVISRKTFHSAIVGPPGSGGPEMLRSKSLSMGVGVGLGLGVGMASQQIRMAGDYGRLGSMSDMTMPGGNGLGGHLEAGPICRFAPGVRVRIYTYSD